MLKMSNCSMVGERNCGKRKTKGEKEGGRERGKVERRETLQQRR